MKKRLLFILCLVVGLANFAYPQKVKTVTNSELEKFREKRVQSERDLKENYQKLGFPSPEELEKQNRERRAAMEEVADQLKTEQLQTQSEIIAQANVLRAQIASLDAQINYLRGQNGNYSSTPGVVLSYGYGTYGYGGGYSPYRGGRPSYRQPSGIVFQSGIPLNVRQTQDIARMYPNSQDVYNRSIGRYAYQNERPSGRIGRGFYRGGYAAPIVIGGGYDYAPNSLDQQLIFLQQQRAGALAQWRLLEEQARRAGVKIN